ncbi:hypothetical protein ACF5W4_16850 [Bacillota bacterium Lsc_1132]
MNKFEKIWLTFFFIELFAGGGGRLIDFGFISIRQILFIGLLLIYIVRIVKEKAIFDKQRNTFLRFTPVAIGVYLILGWFIISSLIGLVHRHPLGAVASDFLRVIFFVVYFPLAYYLSKDRFPIGKVITILKNCALVVAIFTVIVSFLGKTVFVNNFDEFYNFMNSIMHGDLFFRPSNGVFYKSHFFVLVGLVLSLNDLLNKKFTKIDIILIIFGSVSIIWSETRGFLLALILSLLMIVLLDIKVIVDPIMGFARKVQTILKSQQFLTKFVILFIIIIAVPNLYNYMTLARFQTVKVEESTSPTHKQKVVKQEVNDESVNARMKFIVASKDILIHPTNLIFGTGYGTTIAGRITGIEMSFLDILVEQGLIGLATWFFLFLLVYFNYYSAYKKGKKFSSLDISLLSVFMGILLLTNINPFINNPIGISFLLILLVASQNKKEYVPKGGL